MNGSPIGYAVVVPTVDRPELERLLDTLLAAAHRPRRLVVVDDRPWSRDPVVPERMRSRIHLLRTRGRGPAAAREAGRRAADAEWVVFLDDDVLPEPEWPEHLTADLVGLPAHIAGSQGRIRVPPPQGRRPTDREHGTLALARARWITADMAYRADVLAQVGGFDPRFRRAYREDTDLALRVMNAGYGLVDGERSSTHPLPPPRRWTSLKAQRGNADDALMRRLHGRRWRERIAEPPGRMPHHAVATAALLTAAATAGGGTQAERRTAGVAAALWTALTADFAARRIARSHRSPAHVAEMLLSSALIPPLACAHRLAGELRHARARPEEDGRGLRAVLFDRDGTLVHDIAYNADPERVVPLPGARSAVRRAREAGLRVGVVSNQSGVARGLISTERLAAVNARVDDLLGPFDVWEVCVHGEEDRCACRKPRPGMVASAAARLGVRPEECAVVGDTGADMAAAAAAGARGVLVPNGVTRPAEIAAAPTLAADVGEAVDRLLRGGHR